MSREPSIAEVAKGADSSWEVGAANASGPVAFSASDAIACVVWQGSDSAALFSPSGSWIDATTGRIAVSVTPAMTSGLIPGIYPIEVTVTRGTGQVHRVADFWFSLTDSPGSALMPPVYGTYQEMCDYGGGAWLETLRRSEGLVNFTRDRARARSYLDGLIAKKFRPWSHRTSQWSGWGWTTSGPLDARNPTIRDYLAADYTPGIVLPNGYTLEAGQTVLMVTDQVREIVALKALELVCRQRMTLTEKDPFPARASYYQALCRNLVLSTTAELDTDGDGLADYAFNLGVINTR